MVKVIGWGEIPGTKRPYWLIENTWGEDWGEAGLAKIGIVGNDDLGISQLVLAVEIEGAREAPKATGTQKSGKEGKPEEEKKTE